MCGHSNVENMVWKGHGYTLILSKISNMGYKTLGEFAEAIVKAGGGPELIEKSLRVVHSQGYNSGYSDCINDTRKARQSRKKVAQEAFKGEMDIIDDVMRSKWL